MGIGISVFLIAVGAILLWAVNGEVAGVNVDAIGWILLAVGAFGALLSLVFASTWGVGARRRDREERVIVDRR